MSEEFIRAERTRTIEGELYKLLSSELQMIVDLIDSEKKKIYLIELPESDVIDTPLEELASLVARTSNAYGRIARVAGMAKAELKLAKGRYDRKFKRSRSGSNEAERDKRAMDACLDEHVAMTVAESVSSLADDLEQAARVASESARKLYDKASFMNIAQQREDHGTLREKDFTPY